MDICLKRYRFNRLSMFLFFRTYYRNCPTPIGKQDDFKPLKLA